MKTGDDTHEGGKLTQLRRLFPVVVCVWCAGLVGCCGLRGGGPAGTCSGVAVAREVASSVVARPAPGFTAAAVSPEDTFVEVSLDDYQGQYILLAFYPGDFTFVCPTELIALDKRLGDFEARDCQVIGISVDSRDSHLAWKRLPRDQGGIGAVNYPLVSDLGQEIARSYGVRSDQRVALRAWFLIDRQGLVRHATVNDLSIGRSVEEALRTLDAIRFTDEHDEVCPADWEDGDDAVVPTREGVIRFLSEPGSPE